MKNLFILIFSTTLISQKLFAEGSIQESLGSEYRKYNTSFFSLTGTELGASNAGGNRFSSYNYLTVSTRTGSDSKFALRIPFQYNTAGFDKFNGNTPQKQELFLQDVILSWVDYNLILLPWDIGTYWEGRIYLPTSEQSKETKMITRLRNDFIFQKHFTGKHSMEYVSKLNYYHQAQTAYRNEFEGSDGFMVSTVSTTKRFYHDHWVQYWYALGPGSALGYRFGWEDTYYNEAKLEDKPEKTIHEYKQGPSYKFVLNENANFIVNLTEVIDNRKNREEMYRFDQDNLELSLLAFIRL